MFGRVNIQPISTFGKRILHDQDREEPMIPNCQMAILHSSLLLRMASLSYTILFPYDDFSWIFTIPNISFIQLSIESL